MEEIRTRARLVLNGLVELVCDCASTLQTAAELAESAGARKHYRNRAATWNRFGVALRSAVCSLGAPPPDFSGAAGALQRAWIKIKSAIGDSAAISAECAKREQQVLRRCAEAAEIDVPASVRDILDRYSRELSESYNGAFDRN